MDWCGAEVLKWILAFGRLDGPLRMDSIQKFERSMQCFCVCWRRDSATSRSRTFITRGFQGTWDVLGRFLNVLKLRYVQVLHINGSNSDQHDETEPVQEAKQNHPTE